MHNGDYHEISLKECHAWTREGCLHCPDFAAEHADISTGGIGDASDWTLTVVRTELGREIIVRMLQEGVIEGRPGDSDPGAIALMHKLSAKSRQRWPSLGRTRSPTGHAGTGLTSSVSPEGRGGAALLLHARAKSRRSPAPSRSCTSCRPRAASAGPPGPHPKPDWACRHGPDLPVGQPGGGRGRRSTPPRTGKKSSQPGTLSVSPAGGKRCRSTHARAKSRRSSATLPPSLQILRAPAAPRWRLGGG